MWRELLTGAVVMAFAASGTVAMGAQCGSSLPSSTVHRIESQGLVAAVAVREGRFIVGRPLPVLVMLCGAGAETLVGFDADMPAHRHGMNYRPSWKPLGGQAWAVEGVLLHMPGTWRLIIEVQRGNERLRLTREIVVS